jgi:hypothetical protein
MEPDRHIGLIVTGPEAIQDFQIFCSTLEAWHPNAILYVLTDSETSIDTVRFKGTINTKLCMDQYKGKRRTEMEKLPGVKYDNLFKDYTYEKANALSWIFNMHPQLVNGAGVWFMDADITHLATLPAMPTATTIALSPHYIHSEDEAKYGYYNAGYIWMNDPSLLGIWVEAGHSSRFFEQAALEKVAEAAGKGLYKFPIQINFGWWRMFQASIQPQAVYSKFSIGIKDNCASIRYEGIPVQSLHTHWYTKGVPTTNAFNDLFKETFLKLKVYTPFTILHNMLS